MFYHSQRNQSGTYSLELIKAVFTDSSFSEVWHSTIPYQTSSTYYGFTTSAIDSNTNSLWHSISLEDRVVIANQDISTGAQIGSNYLVSHDNSRLIRGTVFSNNILFTTFYSDNLNVVLSFNTTSKQIISIVQSSTTDLKLRDLGVIGDSLYAFGMYTESGFTKGLLLRVHYSYLYRIDTMSNSSITLDEINGSIYTLVNTSLVTGLSVQSEAYTVENNLTGLNDTTFGVDPSSIQSDISDMYLDDVYITNIVSKNNYSHIIDMPCSIDGTTPITYSLIQNGNDAMPSFVSYDNTRFTLNISQPNVNSDTNFTFKIQANTSLETYEREVSISIKACQIANCSLCSDSSVTTCSE